jgi:GxxExxY protein
MEKYKYQKLTRTIIKGYYEVYNDLGSGFLESVYENALKKVLYDYGLTINSQFPIDVCFRGRKVGKFKADLIVENKVLIELKSVSMLLPVHKAQLINYLKATNIEIGLLMNFGDEPEFKRYIFNE